MIGWKRRSGPSCVSSRGKPNDCDPSPPARRGGPPQIAENVVQTQRLPEVIPKGLAEFPQFHDEPGLGTSHVAPTYRRALDASFP